MKKIFISIIYVLLFTGAKAQNYQNVCQYTFEEGESLSNWELSLSDEMNEVAPDFHYVDMFYIGSAEHQAGSKSLYVSQDNGITSNILFGATNSQSAAGLIVQLPAGNYEMEFYYKLQTFQQLYVIIFGNRLNISSILISEHISQTEDWALKNISFTLDEEANYILFIYEMAGSFLVDGQTKEGLAIDNIVIKKELVPHNIQIITDDNGTVTPSKTSAVAGETITLTVAPNDGYELNTLTAMKASNGMVEIVDNQFVMPDDNVVVTATFKTVSAVSQTSADNLSVFVNNRTINVENAASAVQVLDISGRVVAQGAGSGIYEVSQAGVYIVKSGAAVRKVVVN